MKRLPDLVPSNRSAISQEKGSSMTRGPRLVFWSAALMLSWFQSAPVLAQTKITVGVAAMSPRTIPLLIAQEQGLFAKQGIEARIVLIKGAPTLVASLISGDIEVGYTGGTAGLGAASQGLYLRILSSISSK